MEQPLFSCTRCLKNFTHSQMARSGTTCKVCTPHHSSFKQCEYCRSDFKYSIPGNICPRCQSSKTKYGEPKPCTICLLPTAYGNALVCQRCLHYRNKFGDPKQCQKCLQMCAFYKDEISRTKVDGQVLCWVCTYNYKIAKAKERSDKSQSRHSSLADSFIPRSSNDSPNLTVAKRQRGEDYTGRPINAKNYSMDSAYNEHLLTISQLQDDVKDLKRKLTQKDAELLAKDRIIAGLKSDLDDNQSQLRERLYKSQHLANEEIAKLKETIRTMQREKMEPLAARASRKRRGNVGTSGSPLTLSPMRVPPVRSEKVALPTALSTSARPGAGNTVVALKVTRHDTPPREDSNGSLTPPLSPGDLAQSIVRMSDEEADTGKFNRPVLDDGNNSTPSPRLVVDEVVEKTVTRDPQPLPRDSNNGTHFASLTSKRDTKSPLSDEDD